MKALGIFKAAILPEEILLRASQVPDAYAQKVDHVASLIGSINTEAKKLKADEALIAAKRKKLELLVSMAEDSLKEEMTLEGLCEIQGELIKYTLSPSPHRLIIEDESLIPKYYKKETITIELLKDAIKDDLKMGADIPGARLDQGVTLKLTANK